LDFVVPVGQLLAELADQRDQFFRGQRRRVDILHALFLITGTGAFQPVHAARSGFDRSKRDWYSLASWIRNSGKLLISRSQRFGGEGHGSVTSSLWPEMRRAGVMCVSPSTAAGRRPWS